MVVANASSPVRAAARSYSLPGNCVERPGRALAARATAEDISVTGNAGTAVVTWHEVNSVRAAVHTGGAWGPRTSLASPGGNGSLANIGRAAVDAAGNATALWSGYTARNGGSKRRRAQPARRGSCQRRRSPPTPTEAHSRSSPVTQREQR